MGLLNPHAEKFFKSIARALSPAQVVSRPFAAFDSSGFQHRGLGVIYPESEAQVARVVAAANRWSIPLYPVSTGLNAGYGDRYPARHGQVILDLRRMNRILEFNEEEAWLRLEPGTSQEAVAGFLKAHAPHFGFDLTYWLKEASVVGNALERGRTLFAEREPDLIGAKLILGSGAVLRTGFDPTSRSPLRGGMNLHPLIFQSNLGVVVEGVLRLHLADMRARYFLAGFARFQDFARVFTRLSRADVQGLRPLRWFSPESLARSPLPAAMKQKLQRCAGGTLVLEVDRSIKAARVAEVFGTALMPVQRSVFMTTPPLQSVAQDSPFGFFSFTVRRSSREITGAQTLIRKLRKGVAASLDQTISFHGESCQFLLLARADSARNLATARTQMQNLHKILQRHGYDTYRNHSALASRDLPNAKLKKMIKHCFDPKGVISPGRYGL